MNTCRLVAIGIALIAPISVSVAHADEATYRMTLPKGKLQVHLPIELNLTVDAALEPVSVAPDIWVGVADALTVGVVHSAYGRTGIWGSVGNGVCVTGEDKGCAEFYNNVGLELRVGVLNGPFAVAFQLGGYAEEIASDADVEVAVKAGFATMYASDFFSLVFSPNVFVGATARDGGNKERANIPLSLLIGTRTFSVGLQGALTAPFEDAGDNWVLSASAGLQAGVSDAVTLFAVFSLPIAATGVDPAPDAIDIRSITAGAAFSL